MSSLDINDFIKIDIEEDRFVFFSIKNKNATELADFIFNYFFSEEVLYKHVNYLDKIPFAKEKKNFIQLYRFLDLFIDDEVTSVLNKNDYKNIDIIFEEYKLISDKGDIATIRLDKIGKIGEYIFSIILENYFKFNCIIPKTRLITNKNMNVYGIDTLYFVEEEKLILFGESKVSKNISNGIKQLEESLLRYEDMIKNEFALIFTRDKIDQLKCIRDLYKDTIEIALSFTEFTKLAKIDKIGVPLFVAHGTETDKKKILEELKRINKKNLLEMETKYYIISFPIINKSEFIIEITKKIKTKMDEYKYGS